MGKFKAPPISNDIYIKINGTQYGITYAEDDEVYSWEALQNKNTTKYTISNGKVVWNDGTILQYNGTDVLPTDVVVEGREYTTRSNSSSTTKLIKIKFKDTIKTTSNPQTINISFTSNGKTYSGIQYIDTPALRYLFTGDYDQAYFDDSWTNNNFKIIEIDPTQTNFQTFITAMKSNIAGVELEAGTYKWNDSPSNVLEDTSGSLTGEFSFTSNGKNLSSIGVEDVGSNQVTISYTGVDFNGYALNEVGWTNYAYKTITTTENQYVDYDFYNYAILGNQLVKQTPTYKFKHWKKSNVVVNRTLVGQKYYYFKPYTILGLYRIDTTLTNCTGATANATKIQENGGLTLTFTANSGYELPTGVSVTNVTSYNWNKSTGVLAISKPTGDVTIEIIAESSLPQLSTPTNVAVTDTTLTFDEVANATSYEVFVDNVSIGTHSIVTGHTISWSGGGKTPSIKVSINGGEWVKLAEATGSINNVKTIKFQAEFNEFMVATVESTTLNLNFSGDGKPSSITAGSIISSEYTLTQDVTDLVASTAPRKTTI